MAILMSDEELKAQQSQEEAIQSRIASRTSEAGLTPDQAAAWAESQKRQNERKAWALTIGKSIFGRK